MQVKKKSKKKGVGGDGRRQVTNLRDAPYSLKDGDVVAVVDREEDPEGQADLTRAEDEVRALNEATSIPRVLSTWLRRSTTREKKTLHIGVSLLLGRFLHYHIGL